MIEDTVKINEKSILIRYSSYLRKQAQWVENLIVDLNQQGVLIENDLKIKFGWSFLIFREYESNRFILCEPDFSHNPFTDVKQSIDFTIKIQLAQSSFAQDCGVESLVTSFQDKIILAKGCLDKEKLFMERIAPASEQSDSGWFINALEDGNENPELEAIYAFQLLSLRPEIFPALILPPEFIVLTNKEGIAKVINQNNEVVYVGNLNFESDMDLI